MSLPTIPNAMNPIHILSPYFFKTPFNIFLHTHTKLYIYLGDPGGCAVYGVGLRQLACWDCGFHSHRGHVSLSRVTIANHSSSRLLPTVVRLSVIATLR